MVLAWLKKRARTKLTAAPFPESWRSILRANCSHYTRLTEPQQRKLEDDLRILIAEKNWEGCAGLRMTEEIQVTIAAQVALLILSFADNYFDLIQSILVYPFAYSAPESTFLGAGVELVGASAREGEAWYRGPVILSWDDALAGARGEDHGRNLVLHEFAHQLDMQNSRHADGVPPLDSREQRREWQSVMSREMNQLADHCRSGGPTVLDCYGTTHPAEFFAVATESFFEDSLRLKQFHPALYRILRNYYRQDPASRVPRWP